MLISNGAFDLDDFDFNAVHGAQDGRCDDIFRRTGIGESTPVQDRHALSADKGLIGIVRRQDDRDASLGECPNLRHHAHLVAEVEAGGGLIHHQHLGFLSQRASDQRKLALPAAHFRIGPVSKMIDAKEPQQLFRHLNVSR